jgi:hypothetical protein
MRSPAPTIVALLLVGLPASVGHAQQDPCSQANAADRPDEARIVVWPLPAQSPCQERQPPPVRAERVPPSVRPEMLAFHIDTIAGQTVRVPYARVVGVFETSVFLIDSQTDLSPISGHRARVLVFTRGSTLRVTPEQIVGATVTISGVARTLLGMQATAEGWWPTTLTPEKVKKLEIKAALLADSVKTPDGDELTAPSSQASKL